MARFFPETLEGLNPSSVEERVFGYFKHSLGAGESWVWYRPLVRLEHGSHAPGFVLAGPGFGVLVIEIRDWRAPDVLGGGLKQLRVRHRDTGEIRVPHPLGEAEAAAAALKEAFSRAGPRSEKPGPFRGGLLLPMISVRELDALGDRLFPTEGLVLTADHLVDPSPAGAGRLVEALTHRVGRGKHIWDDTRGRRLRAVLQPQIHFFDPRGDDESRIVIGKNTGAKDRGGATAPAPAALVERDPATAPGTAGFFLDRKQERMARGLASPRTVVYGPAGSGKTVFLVARARYWTDRKSDSKVLFTCYNASLASHLQKEFQRRGVATDGGNVTVLHYHDFCRRMLGMGEDFHEKPPEFYAVLEPKVLRALAGAEDPPYYDLILVDEGQDFTRRMIEVLVQISAPGGEITMVSDPAQDLYGRWSEDNLVPFGRYTIERLMDCYRNTAPIFALALSVLSAETREAMGLNRLEMTRPEDLGREGPPPVLRRLAGLNDLLGIVLGTVEEFREEGRPLSELAVLYTSRSAVPDFKKMLGSSDWRRADPGSYEEESESSGDPSRSMGTLAPEPRRARSESIRVGPLHFAEALERELRARGVAAEWVARDFASKMAYDIRKSRLTLSTIHSAKGMDYHTVILMGAETLTASGDGLDAASSLLFTGITRARERLVLPYFERTGWIAELAQSVEQQKPEYR